MRTHDALERLAGQYPVIDIKLDNGGGPTEANPLAEAVQARGSGPMMVA